MAGRSAISPYPSVVTVGRDRRVRHPKREYRSPVGRDLRARRPKHEYRSPVGRDLRAHRPKHEYRSPVGRDLRARRIRQNATGSPLGPVVCG